MFTWSSTGRQVLNAGPLGYVRVSLDGATYYAHRLAWLYMTGEWPACQIDHKDRDRANNRWSNLRAATRSQNQHNRSSHGIERHGNKFRAATSRKDIGTVRRSFDSYEEAAEWLVFVKQELHGEFANV